VLFPLTSKEPAIHVVEDSSSYLWSQTLHIHIALRERVNIDMHDWPVPHAFLQDVIMDVFVPACPILRGGVKHVTEHDAGGNGRNVRHAHLGQLGHCQTCEEEN